MLLKQAANENRCPAITALPTWERLKYGGDAILTYFLPGLIAVIISLCPSPVCPAETPQRISVAYCVDSVPFHFTDENGKPTGIIIDLWHLWSRKTGVSNATNSLITAPG